VRLVMTLSTLFFLASALDADATLALPAGFLPLLAVSALNMMFVRLLPLMIFWVAYDVAPASDCP
jgi:hypothetical protein